MRHSVGVEEVNFVIWLNLGAHFFDSEGNRVSLTVKNGQIDVSETALDGDGCKRHTYIHAAAQLVTTCPEGGIEF